MFVASLRAVFALRQHSSLQLRCCDPLLRPSAFTLPDLWTMPRRKSYFKMFWAIDLWYQPSVYYSSSNTMLRRSAFCALYTDCVERKTLKTWKYWPSNFIMLQARTDSAVLLLLVHWDTPFSPWRQKAFAATCIAERYLWMKPNGTSGILKGFSRFIVITKLLHVAEKRLPMWRHEVPYQTRVVMAKSHRGHNNQIDKTRNKLGGPVRVSTNLGKKYSPKNVRLLVNEGIFCAYVCAKRKEGAFYPSESCLLGRAPSQNNLQNGENWRNAVFWLSGKSGKKNLRIRMRKMTSRKSTPVFRRSWTGPPSQSMLPI
jgi:hypothetical protein